MSGGREGDKLYNFAAGGWKKYEGEFPEKWLVSKTC